MRLLLILLSEREWVSVLLRMFKCSSPKLTCGCLRLDIPVSLGASLLGALWSSLAAQTWCFIGSGNPDRLQPFRWFLKGELHSLTFSEAAEALHVQFALLMKNSEVHGVCHTGFATLNLGVLRANTENLSWPTPLLFWFNVTTPIKEEKALKSHWTLHAQQQTADRHLLCSKSQTFSFLF